MRSQLRKGEQVDILVCAGDLDAAHMVQLRDKMVRLMGRKRKRVLIDLSKARYVDLAGLGILVERLQKFRQLHGDIRLCNLRPRVSETFRLVGLNSLIESYETREKGLESFRFA